VISLLPPQSSLKLYMSHLSLYFPLKLSLKAYLDDESSSDFKPLQAYLKLLTPNDEFLLWDLFNTKIFSKKFQKRILGIEPLLKEQN
jgi:hypothetical protein